MKLISFADLFTEEQGKAVMAIYNANLPHAEAFQRILTEIVEPSMARINEVSGQQNDARYMTHALMHGISAMVQAEVALSRNAVKH